MVRDRTLCRGLHSDTLHLATRTRSGDRVFRRGSEIYVEGEACGDVFNLLDGIVGLYMSLSDGARQITDILMPGTTFGWQELDTAAPVTHTAFCLTDVSVCVMPKSKAVRLMHEEPEVMMAQLVAAGRDNERLQEGIVNLGRRRAGKRLAHFFAMFARRYRETFSGHPVHAPIPVPMSQELIGEALGITSVHVSNQLRELRERGMIEYVNRQLVIRDGLWGGDRARVECEY